MLRFYPTDVSLLHTTCHCLANHNFHLLVVLDINLGL
jgi:hypothetical protein